MPKKNILTIRLSFQKCMGSKVWVIKFVTILKREIKNIAGMVGNYFLAPLL